MKDQSIDRRSMLKTAGMAGAGLAAMASSASAASSSAKKESIMFKNEDFYGADGKFDVEKGKDAIITLCKYHGYPIFPKLREQLWVSDYGTGKFTTLGAAACMFNNNEKDRYMLMDLFLLPGQMLPEHWHLDGETNPAKREGWLVRWGVSHIVGIGEPNLGKDVVVPKCHMGGKVTTEHETIATPGMCVPLAKVYTRHWQFAGPEGAIITEVANVHTNPMVRYSDKAINDHAQKG
jgi:D-lyxose ketol-isomerase